MRLRAMVGVKRGGRYGERDAKRKSGRVSEDKMVGVDFHLRLRLCVEKRKRMRKNERGGKVVRVEFGGGRGYGYYQYTPPVHGWTPE